VPLCIIAERSELPEHDVQSASAKDRDVFDEHACRLDFRDEPGELLPEARASPAESSPPSGNGQVSAGEAAADEIHGNTICRELVGAEDFDIRVARHMRPVLS
jgi:hypothetical protein